MLPFYLLKCLGNLGKTKGANVFAAICDFDVRKLPFFVTGAYVKIYRLSFQVLF